MSRMRPVRASTKNARFPLLKNNKMRAVGDLNACGTEDPIPALFRDGRAYPLLLNLILLYALKRISFVLFNERVSLNHTADKET